MFDLLVGAVFHFPFILSSTLYSESSDRHGGMCVYRYLIKTDENIIIL